MPKRSLIGGLSALALLVVGSSRASADTVNLTFDNPHGTTAAPGVSVSYNNTPGGALTGGTFTPAPYYWTQTPGQPLNSSFGTPVTTFCVQLGQYIQSPTTYSVSSLASTSSLHGYAISPATQKLITTLFNNDYNTSWATTAYQTGSGPFVNSSAFQLALWELVYDGSSYTSNGNKDLTTGNFQVAGSTLSGINTPGTVAYVAAADLSGLASSLTSTLTGSLTGYQIDVLSSSNSQDQITILPPTHHTSPVPAPPGVLLGAMGMVALIGRRSWLRKSAAPAAA